MSILSRLIHKLNGNLTKILTGYFWLCFCFVFRKVSFKKIHLKSSSSQLAVGSNTSLIVAPWTNDGPRTHWELRSCPLLTHAHQHILLPVKEKNKWKSKGPKRAKKFLQSGWRSCPKLWVLVLPTAVPHSWLPSLSSGEKEEVSGSGHSWDSPPASNHLSPHNTHSLSTSICLGHHPNKTALCDPMPKFTRLTPEGPRPSSHSV